MFCSASSWLLPGCFPVTKIHRQTGVCFSPSRDLGYGKSCSPSITKDVHPMECLLCLPSPSPKILEMKIYVQLILSTRNERRRLIMPQSSIETKYGSYKWSPLRSVDLDSFFEPLNSCYPRSILHLARLKIHNIFKHALRQTSSSVKLLAMEFL